MGVNLLQVDAYHHYNVALGREPLTSAINIKFRDQKNEVCVVSKQESFCRKKFSKM